MRLMVSATDMSNTAMAAKSQQNELYSLAKSIEISEDAVERVWKQIADPESSMTYANISDPFCYEAKFIASGKDGKTIVTCS